MTELWTEDTPRTTGGRGRRRRRRKGAVAVVLSLVLVVAIIGGAAVAVFVAGGKVKSLLEGTGADYSGPGTGSVVFEVTAGQSLAEIGRGLKRAGVVASVDAFMAAAEAEPRSTSIQPGSYALREKMKAADALARLLDPSARILAKVTLPEGLRLDETLKKLAAGTKIPLAQFEAALRKPAALGLPAYAKGQAEGFLFPATYDFGPKLTAAQILAQLVAQFNQEQASLGLDNAGRPPLEIVIIASIVEAEARQPADYPKVARVIYNRLAQGMPLQMDSTINYALKADKTIVTLKDLGVNSPYNTYTHPGLPPGPIGSPGAQALQAAISPAPGDWLYFVTTNPATGETKFTSSYSQFLQFKAELKSNQ